MVINYNDYKNDNDDDKNDNDDDKNDKNDKKNDKNDNIRMILMMIIWWYKNSNDNVSDKNDKNVTFRNILIVFDQHSDYHHLQQYHKVIV